MALLAVLKSGVDAVLNPVDTLRGLLAMRLRRAPAPPRSQEALKEDHRAYLEAHPEINGMLNDFVSACLAEQPVDVFEFAQTHFAAEKAEKKR